MCCHHHTTAQLPCTASPCARDGHRGATLCRVSRDRPGVPTAAQLSNLVQPALWTQTVLAQAAALRMLAVRHGWIPTLCLSNMGDPFPGPWTLKPYTPTSRTHNWKQPCHQEPACATDIAMHVHLPSQGQTCSTQRTVRTMLAMHKVPHSIVAEHALCIGVLRAASKPDQQQLCTFVRQEGPTCATNCPLTATQAHPS